MPLERKSLVDQVENALLSEIEQGRRTGLLPGLRELARTLEVSVPTLSAAIERLVRRGALVGRGGRKRFQVAKGGKPAPAKASQARRLLIITSPGGISVQNKVATDVFHAFSVALSRRGWTVQYAEVDFYEAQKPHRKWDDLLKGERIDRILVLFGREAIGHWAVNTGLPTCFLGGHPGNLPIPVIAVHTPILLEHALGRLAEAGHARFLVPLCRRPPSFVSQMRATYGKALVARGLQPRPEIEVPAVDTHTPESLQRLMERAWAQPQPPTALVFMDWRDAVTGLSFLMNQGLRIPRDVSVVLLSHELQANWFRPELAHYRFPEEGFVKALVRWVDQKDHNPDMLSKRMLRSFDPGKSIVPPKA